MPPEEVIPLLDRYLIFYIRTADRLQRTARWIENLPGGIAYLKEVIIEDKLGICADMEKQMQELVDGYFCEWTQILADPDRQRVFRQFDNTEESVETVEVIVERTQTRPAYWSQESATVNFSGHRWSDLAWEQLVETRHFDTEGRSSANIKRGDTQLAVFRVRGRYYATQQMCPHKRAFVLSDGFVGEQTTPESGTNVDNNSKYWVSCPYHKRNFDLNGDVPGKCSSDDSLSISTFAAEARDDGWVYLKLPPVAELDALLGTSRWKTRKDEAPDPFARLDQKLGKCEIGRKGRKPAERQPQIPKTVSISW